jgi:hypothetical protein
MIGAFFVLRAWRFVVRGDYALLSVLHIPRCATVFVDVLRRISRNYSMVIGGDR